MSVSRQVARSLKKKSLLFLHEAVSWERDKQRAKTSEGESWDMKGPFWNYLEGRMLGANQWCFYLIASRCVARLGLTKGWAWEKVMGNCPSEFGAGVTWHFLFKGSFDQYHLWIRLQGWCLKKFGTALLFQISSRSEQVHTMTFYTDKLCWVSCWIFSVAQHHHLLASLSHCLLNLKYLSDWQSF